MVKISFSGDPELKNLPANAGGAGLIPGSGRTPEGGNGHVLRYSCLGNSMDRGAWRATVHEVARVRYDLATKSSKHLDLGRRGLQGAGVIEH